MTEMDRPIQMSGSMTRTAVVHNFYSNHFSVGEQGAVLGTTKSDDGVYKYRTERKI